MMPSQDELTQMLYKKLLGDRYQNPDRQAIVDQNESDASGPNWRAGIAALGAGLQGQNAASAGMGMLQNQEKQRQSKLDNFDKMQSGNDDRLTKIAELIGRKQTAQQLQTDKLSENEKNRQSKIDVANLINSGREKPASSASPKVPEGIKSLDRTFAKDYDEWSSGGEAAVDKNITRLTDTRDYLEKHKDDLFGTSGRITGRLPDILRSEESIKARQDTQAAAQGALKATLGAQFTEREGERIMASAYNEKLSPQENINKINAAILELETAKRNKNQKSSYFENNKSLDGYKSQSSQAPQVESPLNIQESQMVEMLTPNGQTKLIPASKVDEAIKMGARKK